MKRALVSACLIGSVLFGMALRSSAEELVGGYSAIAVSDSNVVAAAAFAMMAEQKAMLDQKDAPQSKLELVKVLKAQAQVVAGMNYRLRLAVKLNGKEREAEAVVWWQAWRSPDPYRLTSWTWK